MQMHVFDAKRGKTRASESRLVLVLFTDLHLIGGKSEKCLL